MLTLAFCALLLVGVCSGQGTPTTYTACAVNSLCVRSDLCSRVYKENALNDKCAAAQVCCLIQDILSTPSANQRRKSEPLNSKCGHRNVLGLMGMMATNMSAPKENEAEYGEFPWTIAVLQTRQVPGMLQIRFHCGGSLIHPRVVLTAAHYMTNGTADSFLARGGEWEPHSTAEPHPHRDIGVKEIVIHEKFNQDYLTYDAALLILEYSFVISPHINTICLPDAGMISPTEGCFVAGWGTQAFQTTKYPTKLKKIDLPVLSTDECNEKLRETRLGRYYALHSSFICAGGEVGKDVCTGDGGSALMCPILGKANYYYQAGVVSWGIGCGETNVPGIYANVASFRPWIERILFEKNLIEKRVYT